MKKRYRKGKVGDVEVKTRLFEAVDGFLEPIREKRKKLSDDNVRDIVREGAERAHEVARKTMVKVRKCLHQVID